MVSDRKSYDDETLSRYLLGSLPPDEAEDLDELSITDDAIAARLSVKENDLVDAYVRGRLTGQAPLAREKVRFAEALLERQRRIAAGPPVAHRHAGWWSLAAVAATVVVAAGYLFMADVRPRREPPPAQASVEPRDRPLPSPPAAAPRATIIASFLIAPATRGTRDITAITIPEGAAAVTLRLPLEADPFPQFEAVLNDLATDATVWRSPRFDAASVMDDRIVSVTVPAHVLTPRRYILILSGVPASGSPETLGGYPFRVTQP